jgi:hypothetical protein
MGSSPMTKKVVGVCVFRAPLQQVVYKLKIVIKEVLFFSKKNNGKRTNRGL